MNQNDPNKPHLSPLEAIESTIQRTRALLIPHQIAVLCLIFGILAAMSFFILPLCAIFAATSIILQATLKRRILDYTEEDQKAFIVHQHDFLLIFKKWAQVGAWCAVLGFLASVSLNASCLYIAQKYAQDGEINYFKSLKLKALEDNQKYQEKIKSLKSNDKDTNQDKNLDNKQGTEHNKNTHE